MCIRDRYNKEETSRAIKYELDTINEFYNKSDDMIEYYIMNALDYLKSAGLIIWRDVYKITSEGSDEMIEIDSDGVVHANIKLETREASKEDMDFYAACIKAVSYTHLDVYKRQGNERNRQTCYVQV